MHRTEQIWRLFVALVLLACPLASFGLDITFAPAAPNASDAVTVQFSQPFNCAAPTPTLVAQSADSLAFQSILPNGIVNCPFIPVPPPVASNFDVPVGALAAGTYAVTWKIYLAQSMGDPQLLASANASLTVSAARADGTAAAVPTPTLSLGSLLALALLSVGLGLRRLQLLTRAPRR